MFFRTRQCMYLHRLGVQIWKEGYVFGHTDKFWAGHDRQIKKNACKNAYLGSIFIPEKYVFKVCFESPFMRMISSLKYNPPPPPGPGTLGPWVKSTPIVCELVSSHRLTQTLTYTCFYYDVYYNCHNLTVLSLSVKMPFVSRYEWAIDCFFTSDWSLVSSVNNTKGDFHTCFKKMCDRGCFSQMGDVLLHH